MSQTVGYPTRTTSLYSWQSRKKDHYCHFFHCALTTVYSLLVNSYHEKLTAFRLPDEDVPTFAFVVLTKNFVLREGVSFY